MAGGHPSSRGKSPAFLCLLHKRACNLPLSVPPNRAAAQFLDRQAYLGLTQEANDLIFGKELRYSLQTAGRSQDALRQYGVMNPCLLIEEVNENTQHHTAH